VNPFKRSFRLPALSLIALTLVACGSGGGATGGRAATVDGIQISEAEVDHAVSLFRFLTGVNQQPCGTPDTGDPANGVPAETDESACTRLALNNLVELVMTDRYADKHQITVPDGDIQDAVKGLDQQAGADAVDTALAAEGLTRDDLTAFARQFLTLREVTKAVTADRLGEDDIRARYDKGIADYTNVQVDHILVKTQVEANDVYAQVRAPGFTRDDFLALAKKISIDPGAQQNSGAYAMSPASQYVPEFAQAAMDLQPGEYGKPVQTQYGWHVIHLVDKQVIPFDQARDKILEKEASTEFPAWVRDRLTQGGIELDPRYGRFDIDNLEVVPIRSTDPSATGTPQPGETATPVNQATPSP
jgi:parvulin-like peptidyl-prolyl isomerase